MSRTVAIIGGGFCGTMTAVHLLRGAPAEGLRVVLVDPSSRIGRGLAYGTDSNRHLLNVPAGGMSALPDDPDHFIRHCRRVGPASAGDFVLRRSYGAYLEALLTEEAQRADPGVVLERRRDTVLALSTAPGGTGATLHLQQGGSLQADQVLLAFGHFRPADPPAVDDAVHACGRYVPDPWAALALEPIGRDDPVAILGSGLTTLDVVLSLHERGHRGQVTCLSRRGLDPLPHRAVAGPVPAGRAGEALLSALERGALPALRAMRMGAEQAIVSGGDWRDLFAAVRPHTPSVWRGWSEAERRRFVRHLQPYWDAHRHRCAPGAGATWAALKASGALEVLAGRLTGIVPRPDGLTLHWRPRGEERTATREVRWLVNCTGPDCRIHRARAPLVEGLFNEGRICPDAAGLGLRVAEDYAVLDAAGRASEVLRYVGPLLRARDWEATAVPELRVHVREAAEAIVRALLR